MNKQIINNNKSKRKPKENPTQTNDYLFFPNVS